MSIVLFSGKHHLDRRAVALIEQANEGTDDELLNTMQTALWLVVSPQWLEIGRTRGWGPNFLKLSPRRVRYRVGDVKKWLAERSYRHTGEYPEAAARGDTAANKHAASPVARDGVMPFVRALEPSAVQALPEKPRRRIRLRDDDNPPPRAAE